MFRSVVWQWVDRQNGGMGLIRIENHNITLCCYQPWPSPLLIFSFMRSFPPKILNQAEHHKKFSYQEEIREIFKPHRVAFDERYVWD